MATSKSNNQSILKKFLVINFIVFLVIGVLTLFYLNTVKPTLIKNKTASHIKIIDNTTENIDRLKINFSSEDIREFLFSTKFLFQSIDRVQIFDSEFNLLGDWCVKQRGSNRKGTLSQQRIDLLNSLDFDWDPKETDWQSNFLELQKFKKKHDHASPSTRSKEFRPLGQWCSNQRIKNRKGNLSSEKFDLLNNIGVKWEFN